MFKEMCLNDIEKGRKVNEEVVKKVIKEVYGRVLSWKEVNNLEGKELRKLASKITDAIKEYKCPVSTSKLTYIIQSSRSGIGGSAMTKFTCKLCGNTASWGNTATPGICKECAEKIAEYIVINYERVLK